MKHFRESGLTPETMLRTQRSRQFLKSEKYLFLAFYQKGEPHDNFWKASILQMAESDIFYVK